MVAAVITTPVRRGQGYELPKAFVRVNADGSEGTGGDASAANQVLQITQETAINTVLGTVAVSPTTNTIGDRLKTINTTLGTPFQAGGTIANASFGISGTLPAFAVTPTVNAAQSGTWNITNISGTISLPTGAATSAAQVTGNTTLGTISTQLPASLGAKVAASSLSVAWATDATLPAGANLVGKVGIDQTTPGTTNNVSATALAQPGGAQPTYTASTQAPLNQDGRGNLRILATGSIQAVGIGAIGAGSVVMYNRDATATAYPLFVANGVSDGSNIYMHRGDTSGNAYVVNQPFAVSASRWQYAPPTGGIVNTTTAVTFIAAAGASVRNYVTYIQFDWDALGTATELVVRDGAAGTVIWRRKIPAGVAGMDECIVGPLKGTANTLLEVATLTASVTGGVYFNAQGFQGT